MSFLNAILLAGAAAFVAPLLIHLFFRTKFKTVDWGAMQFLEVSAQSNSRRLQWQSWLLLLIRCIIPIILAACLARPVLEAWRSAGGSTAVTLIIDNSFSMQSDQADGVTALGTAKRAAKEITQSLPRDAQLCVVSSGGRPVLQIAGATSDKRRIGEVIEQTKSEAGAGKPYEAIQTALQQLSQLTSASKRIVMISDFQNSEWSEISAGELSELRRLCDNASPRVQLSLLPVVNKTENLWAVESLDVSDSLATPDWPISVRATVVSFASRNLERLAVNLNVNGQPLSQQVIDLPAQASKSVAFSLQLDEVGCHTVTVACDSTDSGLRDQIQADNQRSSSVIAAQPLKVVIVDQHSANRSLQSPSGYLRIALSSNSAVTESSLLNVSTFDPSRLSASETDSAVAVVLTNIPRLDNRQLQLLSDFLDRGGLLIVVPGDQLDRNWYNDQLGAKGRGWMPMALTEIIDDSGKPESTQSVRFQSFQHPALTWLNDSEGSLLSSIQWKRYVKLTEFDPSATESDRPAANNQPSAVMLALSGGSPLLVEKSVGAGKVLLWASALEDRWSNLVVRPVFVPLMQQLILQHAASQLPRLNVSTDDRLQLRARQQSSNTQASREFVRLTMPNQQSESVEVTHSGQNHSLEWSDCTQPGLYRIKRLPNDMLPRWLGLTNGVQPRPGSATDLQFSVSSPSRESKMGGMNAEQIQQLSKQLGGAVFDSAVAFTSMEQLQREGYEVFRWLLWGLLIFLFAELWLQRAISKKLG